MTGAVTAFLSFFVNAFPNKKLIGYSYFEQVRDILPSFFAALTMCASVLLVGLLPLNTVLLLILQILTGVFVYVLISVMFKFKSFYFLLNTIKSLKNKGGNIND